MDKNACLASFLEQLHHELAAGLAAGAKLNPALAPSPRRLTLELALRVEKAADGTWTMEPADAGASQNANASSSPLHRLTLELDLGRQGAPAPAAASVVTSSPAQPVATPGPTASPAGTPSPAHADEPPSSGGDPAVMRRQLELVLGGPPGFTSGARADILADLLRVFGRLAILEMLQREWITQFDTGPTASSALAKPPPTESANGEL
jgi:hypothetical protein